MLIFLPIPNVNVATVSEMSMTISGSLIKEMISLTVPSWGKNGLQITIVANNKTGNSAEITELVKLGSSFCASAGGLNVSRGCDIIFFSVDANIGPAIITVGIAIAIPYNKVFPMSA